MSDGSFHTPKQACIIIESSGSEESRKTTTSTKPIFASPLALPKRNAKTTPVIANPYLRNLSASKINSQHSVVSESQSSGCSSSTKKPPVVNNPYSKKNRFIGGAETARRNAQKKRRKGNPITRPDEQARRDQFIPLKINAFDRFFRALLSSSPIDYVHSETRSGSSCTLWNTLCRRLGLEDYCNVPVQAVYELKVTHFAVRAALVLEESRHSIAAALARRWPDNPASQYRGAKQTYKRMNLKVHVVEGTDGGLSKVTLTSSMPFTPAQLYDIRPGSVLECIPRDTPKNIGSVILAIVTTGNREDVDKQRQFQVLTVRGVAFQEAEWVATPLTTLVTELRCFEALTDQKSNTLGFLRPLLGAIPAKHTRFGEDGTPKNEEPKEKPLTEYFDKSLEPKQSRNQMFVCPPLNTAQERAAKAFLDADPNTITLVQGPPGTGEYAHLL